MELIIKGETKEIAALVLEIQGQQKISREEEPQESQREQLIREYENRLRKLKAGASPSD